MSENKKPRIAEILGVEVGEAFSIDGYPTNYGMVQVCEDGKIRRRCPNEIREVTQLEVGHKIGSNALYYLLNHPECVIHEPRWTEQDKEDAEAIRRVFGRGGTVKRYHKVFTEPNSNLVFDSLYINEYLFPSIKAGQEYTLDEIIGGAE